jgi:hypothetical protein
VKAIYLTNVQASVSLFLEMSDLSSSNGTNDSNDTNSSQIDQSWPTPLQNQDLLLTKDDALLLRTPELFAFFCSSRIEIKLHVDTMQQDSGI